MIRTVMAPMIMYVIVGAELVGGATTGLGVGAIVTGGAFVGELVSGADGGVGEVTGAAVTAVAAAVVRKRSKK